MRPEALLTAVTVLLGFLFAGFWWALNRELTFKPEERHFKFGYALLLLSMAILAICGIILPLGRLIEQNPIFLVTYRGIVLAFIGVFGYMLTELGHYSVFQRPKYTTWQEHFFFWSTLLALSAVAAAWFLF